MKRILLSLALLTLVAVGAQAQGAGLSQGQAVKQTTANPTTTRKTCSHCGITMGNITYAWQHESWCPYYRSSGSSSSTRKSTSSYGTYTAASAASYALGSVLSGLISQGFNRKSKMDKRIEAYNQRQAEEEKRRAEWEKERALGNIKYAQDRQSWNYGDYAICIVDGQACVRNTKTDKWVLAPYDTIVFKRDYPNVPRNGFYVPVKGDYEYTKHGRIRFLNSKITGTSPQLDGYLLLRGKGTWVSYKDKKKKEELVKWESFDTNDALCRIVDDTLQFVIKLKSVTPIEKRKGLEVLTLRDILEPIGGSPYFASQVRVFIDPEKKTPTQKYDTYYIYDKQGNIVLREIDYWEAVGGCIYTKPHSGEIKWYDYNLKETQPPFEDWRLKREVDGFGEIHLVKKDGAWGVLGQSDKVILPFVYGSPKDVETTLNYLNTISYTYWYKQEAAKYIDKKGEYEKTEHFEARMNDAKMQEEYLRDIMADAPQRYLAEKTKGGLKLTIGQYDADNEAFPINVGIAPWNSFLLPVSIAEAEAFKTAFDDIKAEAAKNAQLGIRYDAPSIEAITFTMTDGKTYNYGEK
ncbi:MAG: hypothetical protein J6Y04_04290 [Bacteroidaceae bacterium]|nr:hypothetical protein [Bacteroidaceae bacterium]